MINVLGHLIDFAYEIPIMNRDHGEQTPNWNIEYEFELTGSNKYEYKVQLFRENKGELEIWMSIPHF